MQIYGELGVQNLFCLGGDRINQREGPNHPDAAAETEYPADQFTAVGHSQRHEHVAVLQRGDRLARMPDAVFRPGRCRLVEAQRHLDWPSQHDR